MTPTNPYSSSTSIHIQHSLISSYISMSMRVLREHVCQDSRDDDCAQNSFLGLQSITFQCDSFSYISNSDSIKPPLQHRHKFLTLQDTLVFKQFSLYTYLFTSQHSTLKLPQDICILKHAPMNFRSPLFRSVTGVGLTSAGLGSGGTASRSTGSSGVGCSTCCLGRSWRIFGIPFVIICHKLREIDNRHLTGLRNG
jgi:hypothetical protein